MKYLCHLHLPSPPSLSPFLLSSFIIVWHLSNSFLQHYTHRFIFELEPSNLSSCQAIYSKVKRIKKISYFRLVSRSRWRPFGPLSVEMRRLPRAMSRYFSFCRRPFDPFLNPDFALIHGIATARGIDFRCRARRNCTAMRSPMDVDLIKRRQVLPRWSSRTGACVCCEPLHHRSS